MPITQLAYLSRVASTLTQQDVDTILEQSRRNNSRSRVTGHLQCHCGFFFQVLEGPAAEIDVLIDRLRQDRRHEQLSVLFRGSATQRSFANWSMGFGPCIKSGADPLVLEKLQRYHRLGEEGPQGLNGSQVLTLFFELMRRSDESVH